MAPLALLFVALLQAPSPASGQGPSPASPAPAPQAQTPPAASEPSPPPLESYSYSPDGRRDPFLSLLASGTEQGATVERGEGVAGMMVNEISVRGIVQSRGALIAMVQGPDNRTYMVRSGDKLADGAVQSITAEGLVIVQAVNDPLSLVKQRTIRKLLRSLEDAKP
jgi:type IV pilus assembly protein PilP